MDVELALDLVRLLGQLQSVEEMGVVAVCGDGIDPLARGPGRSPRPTLVVPALQLPGELLGILRHLLDEPPEALAAVGGIGEPLLADREQPEDIRTLGAEHEVEPL